MGQTASTAGKPAKPAAANPANATAPAAAAPGMTIRTVPTAAPNMTIRTIPTPRTGGKRIKMCGSGMNKPMMGGFGGCKKTMGGRRKLKGKSTKKNRK